MSEQVHGWAGAAGSRSIGVYDSYAEAERAVDRLSDLGFPVQRVRIVGHDLKLIEQVTGRLNYGGSALRGAGSGALVGLLIGWLFGLFSWITSTIATLLLMLYGAIFGAIVGALFGLLAHWMQGGRRDFSSFRAMTPSRFEVLVDSEMADEAVRLLTSSPLDTRTETRADTRADTRAETRADTETRAGTQTRADTQADTQAGTTARVDAPTRSSARHSTGTS